MYFTGWTKRTTYSVQTNVKGIFATFYQQIFLGTGGHAVTGKV